MTAVERSAVQFGARSIPYVVRRSARRRTVSIAIDPRGGVLVTAPSATPLERLDHVVHAKARWIVDRLGRERGAHPTARKLVSGESFLYLGRQYRLRVVPVHSDLAIVRLSRGWLWVPVEARLGGDSRASAVRSRLVRWYREHAARRLVERLGVWVAKLGIREPRVVIREQHRRWASCSPDGAIRLNWRIVQAPLRLVDHVVAHELVHLAHPNHTPAFWRALGRVMRDYDARRDALRAIGCRLEW